MSFLFSKTFSRKVNPIKLSFFTKSVFLLRMLCVNSLKYFLITFVPGRLLSKNRAVVKNVVITLLLFYCVLAYSQDEKYTWLNTGCGGYFSNENHTSGISIDFDYNINKKSNLLTFRYIYNLEFVLFTDPYEYLHDLGILCGRVYRNEYLLASASAGVGFVSGIVRSGLPIQNPNPGPGLNITKHYNSKIINNLGIPIELQASYFAPKRIGIGLKAFANINPDNPVFGVLVTLQWKLL
jgi:hypothetical protein